VSGFTATDYQKYYLPSDNPTETVYIFTDTTVINGSVRPTTNFTVNFLVVGGGGGGGVGGGGAGGLLSGTMSLETTLDYPINVGDGGAANTNGADSKFTVAHTAFGGGHGSNDGNGADGGSGGGGYNTATSGPTSTAYGGTPTITTPEQGKYGGNSEFLNGYPGNPNRGGGGGGAGTFGDFADNYDNLGNGGNGLSSSLTGPPTMYAGGGGGNAGQGGSGVGGNGGGDNNGSDGISGRGGGGGGGKNSGGRGGSGVVILVFPYHQ